MPEGPGRQGGCAPRRRRTARARGCSVIRTVLVANRGEIAVRVIRACRALGIRVVAVFSDADRAAPHVFLADEAYRIGAAPPGRSYLRTDRILRAARASAADAVHPGYGFLAEDAGFARAVEDAGLIFIGPEPATIAAMGDKARARETMAAAGIPTIPGSCPLADDVTDALDAADRIGFPLLVKAVAGGGGRGMRVVDGPGGLANALEASRREAAAAFGDGRLYLERYLERPRHIEVQVFGDGRGSVVHFGDRDCSIQRRHQKLVEEAPAPTLEPETSARLRGAALRAAETIAYRGAGTVEFLVEDGDVYFLEMNTRIQVEHPVTECVTGTDLVQLQIRVAGGEALSVRAADTGVRGHAIECRITAESAPEGFLPSAGVVRDLEIPSGPGIRWDGGVLAGTEVGLHYDSLLGKLVAHGSTRANAIARMAGALDELVVDGVTTTRAFHRAVMDEPDFRAGRLSTRYLEEHPGLLRAEASAGSEMLAAAVSVLLEAETRAAAAPARIRTGGQAWRNAPGPGRRSRW